MKQIVLVAALLTTLLACQPKETIISNPNRQADIQRMLGEQKRLTANAQVPVWDIFDQQLTADEKSLMEFWYAYMPLSDLADYPADFFLNNVRYTLKAKEEMPWGRSIPEEEFLHFVLPLRVNNENLDNFRAVMYDEIKARVKGLGMKEAALEINHWCHEKVNYRGTDGRTSAPLSTVKKTFGRCGEESTFTVTAMRTAGIPARQVYTPRWAHSDDNHAWVEVWIDGKWRYLGACEPDVDLDMGWFSEPARRTMLVHTRAFGHYFGNENVITPEARFSELNLTANYTTVKNVVVKVRQANGAPADSAKVEFQLYNYAEYYPIATDFTNSSGEASLLTGMGDLIVWAAKEGHFGYQKLSVPETDTLTILLNQTIPADKTEPFDLIPPHAAKVELNVSEEARNENNRRLAKEDSIRNATMATFKDSLWSAELAAKTNLPAEKVKRYIHLSYGNWDQIAAYLEKNGTQYPNTVALLEGISAKDFSDTPEAILTDHLQQAEKNKRWSSSLPAQIYTEYVLAPRISNELLSPWRSFLTTVFDQPTIGGFQKDISLLSAWIREHIAIDAAANKHSRSPLSPKGVFNLRVADADSRDIFFVAVCRTIGIPARLNPESRIPEYYQNGQWYRAGFGTETVAQPDKGSLKLQSKDNLVVPQYYLHFTIGILKDGFFRTLEFPEGASIATFEKPVELEVGHYALVTGNRLDDGSVLSSMTTFSVEKGKTTVIPVTLRQQSGNMKPSGKIDFTQLMLQQGNETAPTAYASLLKGSHSVVVLLDPDKEPSKHILNDLGPYVDHFNQWGGEFLFAMPAEKAGQAKVLDTYTLPAKRFSGIDIENKLLNALTEQYGSGLKDKLPLVLFCDQSGNIYLFSSGYKIGMGEQLLKVIAAIESGQKTVDPKASCTAGE